MRIRAVVGSIMRTSIVMNQSKADQHDDDRPPERWIDEPGNGCAYEHRRPRKDDVGADIVEADRMAAQ